MWHQIIAILADLERRLDRVLRERQESNTLLREIAQRLRDQGG